MYYRQVHRQRDLVGLLKYYDQHDYTTPPHIVIQIIFLYIYTSAGSTGSTQRESMSSAPRERTTHHSGGHCRNSIPPPPPPVSMHLTQRSMVCMSGELLEPESSRKEGRSCPPPPPPPRVDAPDSEVNGPHTLQCDRCT